MAKAYMAIVKTPLGVWDNTASVCIGHEAEYRAKARAKRLFVADALPPFMTAHIDMLVDSYWRAAQMNGCEMIVREVDVDSSTESPRTSDVALGSDLPIRNETN